MSMFLSPLLFVIKSIDETYFIIITINLRSSTWSNMRVKLTIIVIT